MSLIKQLWLAIIFIVSLAAGGSFILSTLSSKNYLEEQLQLKNIDNVTSLALSMSQMDKDPTTLNLLIAAQFDSGHYRYIGLFDPNGKMIAERVNANSKTTAPSWFVKLVPIKVQAGVADVQAGWSQYGSLTLESDTSSVYDKLWDATIQIALWTLLIGLLSCYVGGKILSKILSPLDDVVRQAQAIGENRFVTIDVPKTTEFKAVVNAMNSLSNRIKKTLVEESSRLEQLRFQANFDPITGLMNHDYFMNRVNASISYEETFSEGLLVISRLSNLTAIDHALGYQETNILLRKIGDALENACKAYPSLYAGRITGTDFAIFSNQPIDGYTLGNRVKTILENASHLEPALLTANFLTVAVVTTRTESAGNLSSLVDAAGKLITFVDSILNSVDRLDKNTLHVISHKDLAQYKNNSLDEWRRLITSALDHRRIKLEQYPVINQNGELIHYESPVRLQLEADGKWYCAGEFITWATQLRLMSRVDEMVLETAIDLLVKGAEPIGLNISASAICDPKFIESMIQLIKKSGFAHRLCLEVPEKSAFNHLAEFRSFCSQLKSLGCKIGIEHVGSQIARLGELHDVGLDYIKIDVSIIRSIDSNEANKTLLRGLAMIAHSIGIIIIAEGVGTESEATSLKLIGIDGMTGPAIRR